MLAATAAPLDLHRQRSAQLDTREQEQKVFDGKIGLSADRHIRPQHPHVQADEHVLPNGRLTVKRASLTCIGVPKRARSERLRKEPAVDTDCGLTCLASLLY